MCDRAHGHTCHERIGFLSQEHLKLQTYTCEVGCGVHVHNGSPWEVEAEPGALAT